jgi:hypothetical protein
MNGGFLAGSSALSMASFCRSLSVKNVNSGIDQNAACAQHPFSGIKQMTVIDAETYLLIRLRCKLLRGLGALCPGPFASPRIAPADRSIRSVAGKLPGSLNMFSIYRSQLHDKLQRAHVSRRTGSIGLHRAAGGTDHVPTAVRLRVREWIFRQVFRPNTRYIARRVRWHSINAARHGHLPSTGFDT